jgi:hypothetical protein
VSTIVTFLIVGAILAVAAAFAVSEADNGASSGGQSRRDPDTPTYGARVRAAARAVGAALAAAGTSVVDRVRRGRERRADRRAASRRSADPPEAVGEGSDLRPVPTPRLAAPREAVAPAGTVLVGETVGEPVERATPTPGKRIRSFAELVVMIGLLGLAVAAVLGTLVTLGGRALDDFVG